MPLLLSLSIAVCSVLYSEPESIIKDTLAESVHISSFKQSLPVGQVASPVSVMYMKEMENRGLKNPKDFSAIVPNLHIPDYGSAMTSSVYMRGFGSRIDNPVIGLYIDDMPVLDKNCYDFDMLDIRRIDLFRGPQGTLYGRNAMCGVLSMTTVSPLSYQGVRAAVEYGSANSVGVRVSAYGKTKKGFGIGGALGYRRSDGFYTNEYTGTDSSPYDALSFRMRAGKEISSSFTFENILSASMLWQGGYPYRLYDTDTGVLNPVSYNGPGSYRRLSISDAVKLKASFRNFTFSSVTSWQMLMDEMDVDQDFTPASMFTLVQSQNSHAFTQEFILKPEAGWRRDWWDWQTGVFGFYRHNVMSAPVTFLRDGIDSLIIGEANSHMPPFLGKLDMLEDSFVIASDFGIGTYGAAIYHESYFNAGRWRFTAGLRVDYEGNDMKYDSRSTINYKLGFIVPQFREVETVYKGDISNDYVEFLPKISAMYSFGEEGEDGTGLRLYATLSKGYKSGGFNTQIFSDVLQNKMMAGMISDAMGGMGGGSDVSADNTSYRPERSFNYEIGTNFNVGLPGNGHTLKGSAALFYIDCRNQQITVFPEGKSTGRMMLNVGRSYSLGAELELHYRWKGLSASLAYGYTDARFLKYNDGNHDYSGNRIPYSPSNTLNLRAGYRFGFGSDICRSLTVSADVSGTGKIWWDEANTLSQPLYMLLGADMMLSFKWFDLFVRGENITDADYNVFYFKSVGNSFFQTGKPARFSLGLMFDF